MSCKSVNSCRYAATWRRYAQNLWQNPLPGKKQCHYCASHLVQNWISSPFGAIAFCENKLPLVDRRFYKKMSQVALHDLSQMSADERDELMRRTEDDLAPFLEKIAPIVAAIRIEGDAALVRFAKQFDGAEFDLSTLAASDADFDRAYASLDPEFIDVLRYSADNIRRFHERQMPEKQWMMEIREGAHVGERFTPIDSVACYSPRGKGSFPSVTLMSIIPAIVAGVPEVIVLTPAGPDGEAPAKCSKQAGPRPLLLPPTAPKPSPDASRSKVPAVPGWPQLKSCWPTG
jgi:hypothetical protein